MDRATELRLLARQMHKQPNELAYLKGLDAEGLFKLRTALQERMLDEFAPTFEKMAAGGKIAPDALSAMLCKKVFGPTLTANMSYFTPPSKAAKMCKHFDTAFMAEVSRETIPQRAEEMLKGLPVDLMKPVTRALLESGDYHIMGGFTDYMPEDKINILMQEIKDPADNLRISTCAQRKDRIAAISSRFDDDTLTALIEVGYQDAELILELALTCAEMPAESQQRMARLTDAVNPGYREKSREMAEQAGLLDRMQDFFDA